jgi:hypothetical protein
MSPSTVGTKPRRRENGPGSPGPLGVAGQQLVGAFRSNEVGDKANDRGPVPVVLMLLVDDQLPQEPGPMILGWSGSTFQPASPQPPRHQHPAIQDATRRDSRTRIADTWGFVG